MALSATARNSIIVALALGLSSLMSDSDVYEWIKILPGMRHVYVTGESSWVIVKDFIPAPLSYDGDTPNLEVPACPPKDWLISDLARKIVTDGGLGIVPVCFTEPTADDVGGIEDISVSEGKAIEVGPLAGREYYRVYFGRVSTGSVSMAVGESLRNYVQTRLRARKEVTLTVDRSGGGSLPVISIDGIPVLLEIRGLKKHVELNLHKVVFYVSGKRTWQYRYGLHIGQGFARWLASNEAGLVFDRGILTIWIIILFAFPWPLLRLTLWSRDMRVRFGDRIADSEHSIVVCCQRRCRELSLIIWMFNKDRRDEVLIFAQRQYVNRLKIVEWARLERLLFVLVELGHDRGCLLLRLWDDIGGPGLPRR